MIQPETPRQVTIVDIKNFDKDGETVISSYLNNYVIFVQPVDKHNKMLCRMRMHKPGGKSYIQTVLPKGFIDELYGLVHWERINQLPDGCRILEPTQSFNSYSVKKDKLILSMSIEKLQFAKSFLNFSGEIPLYNEFGSVTNYLPNPNAEEESEKAWKLIKIGLSKLF